MAKFNQDGGGGGGAAPAAPAAPSAPASAPASPSPAPAPAAAPAAAAPGPSGGVTPPAGSQQDSQGASPTPTPAPAATGNLIDTLPARYSPEYWAKYGELSHEQRLQVEREWTARDNGQDAPPASDKPQADPAAAPLPGDKPKADAEVFITQETLDKLPPEVKQVVETMQARIDEFAPIMDEKFGKGMQMFMEDPIIKQRMEEISTGKVWEPGELAKGFKADTYLAPEALQGLDFIGDPEGSAAKVNAALQKAHEDGIRQGQTSEQYQNQQRVAFAERKAAFVNGFNELVTAHPELKPTDPSVKEITHPQHPLRPVLAWAKEKLGDRFFLDTGNGRNPFKAAYAAFLADGGQLDAAISKTVASNNLKFIRNLKVAQDHAATVGRTTPSASAPRPSPIPNLDQDRYLSDPVYARSFYDNADHDTRLKLEKIRYGEKVT